MIFVRILNVLAIFQVINAVKRKKPPHFEQVMPELQLINGLAREHAGRVRFQMGRYQLYRAVDLGDLYVATRDYEQLLLRTSETCSRIPTLKGWMRSPHPMLLSAARRRCQKVGGHLPEAVDDLARRDLIHELDVRNMEGTWMGIDYSLTSHTYVYSQSGLTFRPGRALDNWDYFNRTVQPYEIHDEYTVGFIFTKDGKINVKSTGPRPGKWDSGSYDHAGRRWFDQQRDLTHDFLCYIPPEVSDDAMTKCFLANQRDAARRLQIQTRMDVMQNVLSVPNIYGETPNSTTVQVLNRPKRFVGMLLGWGARALGRAALKGVAKLINPRTVARAAGGMLVAATAPVAARHLIRKTRKDILLSPVQLNNQTRRVPTQSTETERVQVEAPSKSLNTMNRLPRITHQIELADQDLEILYETIQAQLNLVFSIAETVQNGRVPIAVFPAAQLYAISELLVQDYSLMKAEFAYATEHTFTIRLLVPVLEADQNTIFRFIAVPDLRTSLIPKLDHEYVAVDKHFNTYYELSAKEMEECRRRPCIRPRAGKLAAQSNCGLAQMLDKSISGCRMIEYHSDIFLTKSTAGILFNTKDKLQGMLLGCRNPKWDMETQGLKGLGELVLPLGCDIQFSFHNHTQLKFTAPQIDIRAHISGVINAYNLTLNTWNIELHFEETEVIINRLRDQVNQTRNYVLYLLGGIIFVLLLTIIAVAIAVYAKKYTKKTRRKTSNELSITSRFRMRMEQLLDAQHIAEVGQAEWDRIRNVLRGDRPAPAPRTEVEEPMLLTEIQPTLGANQNHLYPQTSHDNAYEMMMKYPTTK